MKRAIIYARVSKLRDESVSIEAQIEQCQARAAALGAAVVKVFTDEGISGQTVKHRGSFQRARAFCEAGGVDYLITWSTSRFARNILELWSQSAQLKEYGTRLECLNADIDDETDAGFINKVFHGAMDEMFTRQVARDTLRSQKKSAEDGFWTGGRMPFGYRPLKVGKRTRLEEDPAEAATVRRMFELALDEGLGALAISMRLNDVGLLHRGKRWTRSTVGYVLKNEIYIGVRIFNKTSRKRRTVKPKSEWMRKEGCHPALIGHDDFRRLQTMIEERVPHDGDGGGNPSQFVFTGLLNCGCCGNALQITNGTNRTGVRYSYYSCVRHRKGEVRCLFKPVRADQLDDWLLGQILEKVLTKKVVEDALVEIRSHGAAWLKERATARAKLVADIREVERARDRLYEVLELNGKDAPDLGAISARLHKRQVELVQLQTQLMELEAARPPEKVGHVDTEVAIEVMRETIAAGETKKKRTLMGALLTDVTVDPTRVTVRYRPQALLKPADSAVISGSGWLPVQSKLITSGMVEFLRPYTFPSMRKSA